MNVNEVVTEQNKAKSLKHVSIVAKKKNQINKNDDKSRI